MGDNITLFDGAKRVTTLSHFTVINVYLVDTLSVG